MPDDSSVTTWIGKLQRGDEMAAERLWQRYFARLVDVARDKLNGAALRAFSEEDVALSAFHSFCRGLQANKFPRLSDRNDLWRLLVVLTARKAWRRRRDENRLKRGGGRVYCETDLNAQLAGPNTMSLAEVIGAEPTPAFAAEMSEQVQLLLDALKDERLRQIALWKLDGESSRAIAALLGVSQRTVDRKLDRIRCIWWEASDDRNTGPDA